MPASPHVRLRFATREPRGGGSRGRPRAAQRRPAGSGLYPGRGGGGGEQRAVGAVSGKERRRVRRRREEEFT